MGRKVANSRSAGCASGERGKGKTPLEGGTKTLEQGFAEGTGEIKAACEEVGVLRRASCRVLDRS